MSCNEIAELRDRIIIESPTNTPDGMGGYSQAWATFATVWANVKAMKAGEVLWAKKLEHRVTHKIIVRYRTDLTAEMRVNFNGTIFQIKGIRPVDNMKRFTELTCEQGVPA